MNSHIDSFHMNQVKVRCMVCGQEFRKAYNLKVHMKSQHKVIETPIVVDAKMPPAEPINYYIKMCSDDQNKVGTLHIKMYSDVHTRVGTPHMKTREGHCTFNLWISGQM